MKTTPGKAPGKGCLADLYDMTEVTPATISGHCIRGGVGEP